MYAPTPFRVDDRSVQLDFLKEHPFGMLLLNGMDGIPMVAHLPFTIAEIDGEVVLEMHISKYNNMVDLLKDGCLANCCVQGAKGYVSSSVYGHPNVPTYNYQSVQVHGTIKLLSKSELQNHLETMVVEFEKLRSKPLDYEALPKEMLAKLTDEIIGVRLSAFRIEGVFKLSQNRNQEDLERIVNDLEQGSIQDQQLASTMRKINQL